MMGTFTPRNSRSATISTTPITARPTLRTTDHNIESQPTPPLSPVKQAFPTTPKTTPLYRHFSQKVRMSPATPPRTPTSTHKKRDSLAKGRESPTKGRESPTKHHLEIGQNGFYFSCELPMSKVTPKKVKAPGKVGTPQKNDTGRSATRTPSPSKIKSATKPSPAKALFMKKVETSARDSPGSGVKPKTESDASPTKSIKLTPKLVQNLSSRPRSTLRIPPECLIDINAAEFAHGASAAPANEPTIDMATPTEPKRPLLSSQPSNIGHLMVGLRNTTTAKPCDSANATSVGGSSLSPAPTPLRRASDKLRQLAPQSFYTTADVRAKGISWNLLKDDSQTKTSHSAHHSQEKISTGSRCVGTKDKSVLTDATTAQIADQAIKPTSEVAQLVGRSDSSTRSHIDMSTRVAEHELHYQPLLFPKSEPDASKIEQVSLSDRHVKWKAPAELPSQQTLSRIPKVKKRVGTDPGVLRAMKTEMVSVEAVMRASMGQSFIYQGPANNNELPVMSSNAFFRNNFSVENAKSACASKPLQSHSRANSHNSVVQRSDASSATGTQKRDDTQNMPTIAPSAALGEMPDIAKQVTVHKEYESIKTEGSPRKHLMSSNAHKSSKSTTTTADTTPHKFTKAIDRSSVSRPRARYTSLHAKPPVTPGKKSNGTSIPRSIRKSVFDAPASAETVPKSPQVARKLFNHTSRVRTGTKCAISATPEPHNSTIDPRPSENKFASAIDIADMVAEWHEEDRQNAAMASPAAKAITKTPLKGTKTVDLKSKAESFTPEGSPAKPASPIKHPKIRSIQPKSIPNSPAPKTPVNKKTAATRMRDHGTLRTPVNSPMKKFARNALRTPSKAIQSSLDKAIDAKIAEDVEAGREFTPGGNRVKDLLEARKRVGS